MSALSQTIVDGLLAARIELGAYVGITRLPCTERGRDAVDRAISYLENETRNHDAMVAMIERLAMYAPPYLRREADAMLASDKLMKLIETGPANDGVGASA